MVFLGFDAAAILTAVLRLAFEDKRRSRQQVAELLVHVLAVAFGLGDLVAFVWHRFRAEEVAESIGWQPGSPFQQEIAVANLGYGVAGLMAGRSSRGFRRGVATLPRSLTLRQHSCISGSFAWSRTRASTMPARSCPTS